MVRWVIRSFLHVVNPLSYFLFQPVLHNWCNKGCGMCYPVCGMVHIKEPLLLIVQSSLCGGSGFPLSLSEWSFTICSTPYNHKQNVMSASLNKTFPSFLPSVSTKVQVRFPGPTSQLFLGQRVSALLAFCASKVGVHLVVSHLTNERLKIHWLGADTNIQTQTNLRMLN